MKRNKFVNSGICELKMICILLSVSCSIHLCCQSILDRKASWSTPDAYVHILLPIMLLVVPTPKLKLTANTRKKTSYSFILSCRFFSLVTALSSDSFRFFSFINAYSFLVIVASFSVGKFCRFVIVFLSHLALPFVFWCLFYLMVLAFRWHLLFSFSSQSFMSILLLLSVFI